MGGLGELQIVYSFCVFFVAATLLLMAYAEGFEDVEVYYEEETEKEP